MNQSQSQGQISLRKESDIAAALRSAPSDSYNEFSDGERPRPHQERLDAFLRSSSRGELDAVANAARNRLMDQEVTVNVHGDPKGGNRAWQLDPIPLLIDSSTWSGIEAGIVQRSRVLDAIFKDVYGPQRLLKQRIIPPELILGNPHFARGCVGHEPLGGFTLHLGAFDLGRHADGRFFVYSDRSAAPAGSGYTLENRLALGSALRGLFESYGVRRLRRYFDRLKASVAALSPRPGADDVRIVVLSPGFNDESAFEHAYLTRYLGYELVEGRDLTVRDRSVYLKTLSGLKQVDIVIRRIHDQWCDPLALRGDSFMGVAGLADAAAAGNVTLINPLGAAVTETPALKAYWGVICRFLLGEELILPSVPTYWGGDARSLQYMWDHFDDLIFKPAFKERFGPRHAPSEMSSEDKETLLARVRATPNRFIAEEWSPLSVVPTMGEGGLHYEPVSFRTFSCLRKGEYVVMPGGLGRVDSTPDGIFLTTNEVQLTKDVWIISEKDEASEPVLQMKNERVALRRGGLELPSRLLDDHFWLGRYVERGDVSARLLRAGLERLSSEAGEDAPAALERVNATLRAMEVMQEVGSQVNLRPENALLGAIFDENRHNSLREQLRRVHQLARRARSRLSRDTWNILHRASTLLEARPLVQAPTDVAALLDNLLILLSAMRGATLDNMVRSHTWTFLDMGRQVERSLQTLTLLSTMLQPGTERVHMEVLLEVADSLLTYRSRYLSSLQIAPVIDLLLTDDTNPRSLAYQANRLQHHISHLPQREDVLRSRAEKRIISLQSLLLTCDVVELCSGDGSGLRALLDEAGELLWLFSDDVTRTWFSHASRSRPISPPHWVNENLEAGP